MGSNGARVCTQLVRTPCRRGKPFMFHGEHAGDLQECRAHHRCRAERRAVRPPIPLLGGVSRVSEGRAHTRGDPETPRPHVTPAGSAHPAADVQVAHSRAPPLLSTGSHAVREPSSRSATGAHRGVGGRIHRVVHIGGQRRASDLTRADPGPRRMHPTGALGDSTTYLGGEPYTSDF